TQLCVKVCRNLTCYCDGQHTRITKLGKRQGRDDLERCNGHIGGFSYVTSTRKATIEPDADARLWTQAPSLQQQERYNIAPAGASPAATRRLVSGLKHQRIVLVKGKVRTLRIRVWLNEYEVANPVVLARILRSRTSLVDADRRIGIETPVACVGEVQ